MINQNSNQVPDFDQFMGQVHELFDANPIIPAALTLFLLFLIYLNFRGKRAAQQSAGRSVTTPIPRGQGGGLLSQVLFWWSPFDPMRISDLLRSIAIFGASGSGKTTGSGYQIARAIVGCGKKIGGLICASKPEDREFWQRVFRQAGRTHDLLVFSAVTALRFNFIDFILRNGGSTRDITQAILIVGERLNPLHGENFRSEQFWQQQKQRLVYNSAEIVQRALGRVTAPYLQEFISGAAQSPAELATPQWQAKFHSKCLEDAHRNVRTAVERHDYQLAADFWLQEYPAMNDRTRSSMIAEVMGTLHVFNTGMVRELVSTTTNVSPAVMDEGKWILVDMPISSEGAAGAFILGGWKYLTQWHVLKRHATESTPVCVIWADEAQKVLNSFDAAYLAECRSHRGCMVCLTQSIHSYYARIREGGEHETDALLTNFFHKIFHALGDDKTAAYASSLIGRRLTTHIGGSTAPVDNVYDELFGRSRFSASFSQSMENVLENREFMQNLRTGGNAHNCIVDGIIVRSGEPFSNGEAFMKVAFSQK